MNEQKLWVLKTKGENAAFGGNLGYPDQPTSHYVYDTNVKNHDKLFEGDLVIIADKKYIIGYASVTHIEVHNGIAKVRLRCPHCNTQEHYIRKTIQPKYQCRNKHTFDCISSTKSGQMRVKREEIPLSTLNALKNMIFPSTNHG